MAEDFGGGSIGKYVYTWIAIMISINILSSGFLIVNQLALTGSSDSAYSLFTEEQGEVDTSSRSVLTFSDFDAEDILEEGDVDTTLQNKEDRAINSYVSVRWLVSSILLGGFITAMSIDNYIQNDFLAWFFALFFTLSNLLMFFLILKATILKKAI